LPRLWLHLPSKPLGGAGKDNGKIGKVASENRKLEIFDEFLGGKFQI